jgi:hypothetical protein
MAGRNTHSGSTTDGELTHLVGQYQAKEVACPMERIIYTVNLNIITKLRVGWTPLRLPMN